MPLNITKFYKMMTLGICVDTNLEVVEMSVDHGDPPPHPFIHLLPSHIHLTTATYRVIPETQESNYTSSLQGKKQL